MLTNNNINFDVNIIKDCLKSIEPSEPKEELLARLTYDKLKIYNENYMNKFNKVVDDLYECAVSSNVKGMATALKRLSNVSHDLFSAELNIYKRLSGCGNDR